MGKLGNIVDVAQNRFDNWYNALTGLGNSMRDKSMSTQFVAGNRLSDSVLDNLYHEDDMAARICEALPEEALRKGYNLSIENEEDSDIPGMMREYEKRLGFRSALEDCCVWSRVYGGCVIYMGIDDGSMSEAEPVNMERIRSVRWLEVLDKRSLTPESYYDNPDDDTNFGKPETYKLHPIDTTRQNGETGEVIHETRLLRMDGTRTSRSRQLRNNGWSESVLQKIFEALSQFSTGWQATSHVMQDASQGVFKIDGLIDMIAGGDKDTLQTRMELVEMGRSVARSIMLDAEKEDFHREAYSFAGIPDVLRAFMLRLAAAARMPVTVLMGQSPQGLNSTGESDIRLWYDRVQSYQSNKVEQVIQQFYEIVFAAEDFEAELPESWDVIFERLWQLTDSEQATLEKTTADKDKIYIDAGVILPEEVAINRFKARGFNTATQIDMDAREEMLQAEIELAKDKAGEEPVPVMPQAGNKPVPGEE